MLKDIPFLTPSADVICGPFPSVATPAGQEEALGVQYDEAAAVKVGDGRVGVGRVGQKLEGDTVTGNLNSRDRPLKTTCNLFHNYYKGQMEF